MNGKFTELHIWKEGIKVCVKSYDLIKKFPPEEQFALSQQLRRCLVSIPSNIAEGYAKGTNKEFIQGMIHARGSNAEAQTQFIIACQLGYLNEQETQDIINDLEGNAKGINKMISYIKTLPNTKPTKNPTNH